MDNLLIEASAGTGKTQRLGLRLVELLNEAKVEPHHIVALTFSRAAAGEIFERFVSLLANSAKSDAKSALSLRKVISVQHLSQIGTLDSFLMRMLRAFPLELGLSGDLEIMDPSSAESASNNVASSVLRRTDESVKNAFIDAFLQAMNYQNVSSFAKAYSGFVNQWHSLVAAMPEKSSWGDPFAIWGSDVQFAHVTEKELEEAASRVEEALKGDEWAKFAQFVRTFRGSFGKTKGYVSKLLELDNLFSVDAISFKFNRREIHLSREETLIVRDAIMCVYGYVVRMKLDLARGVYCVISEYEAVYDRLVRRKGRLVFSDVPRLIASLPEDLRLQLEYRMDSRIGAWALDEFQDTSRSQWASLSNLIDEAKQSGGATSLFVVGDRKQAIYGWREGDVEIFTRERESGFYEVDNLRKTYRLCPAIAEAVSRVFARGRILSEFPSWKGCPEHESGKPDVQGFVRTIEASSYNKEDFVSPVYSALSAVLGDKCSDPRRRGISAAVLVRENSLGEFLAAELKTLGFEGVVWEGESQIADTPALSGFLDLFQLADHPGDVVTYRHFAMTPLAAAKYPDGLPSAAEISREMSLAFTSRGIARTLRELRACFPDSPDVTWSRFTEERFVDVLRSAEEFEQTQKSQTRLADFPQFLKSKKKRAVASDGLVRIMTIHRSKGLGFDYVVLPLAERKGLKGNPSGPLIGDGWVLPVIDPHVARAVPKLKEAWELLKDRGEQEALCTYYVAMTRAKKGMTIILTPEGQTIRFSDLVRSASLDDLVNADVKLLPSKEENKDKAKSDKGENSFKRSIRVKMKRRLPSLGFTPGMSAGDLFASNISSRKVALERGIAVHAEYEAVEWLEPEKAVTPLEKALVKPDHLVALWREKPFEVFLDGVWSSGRFDRVVFEERDGATWATVLDFKTNRLMRGEDSAAFAKRMSTEYSAQMSAYRSAVSSLTGINPERITSLLLLVSTGEVVELPR